MRKAMVLAACFMPLLAQLGHASEPQDCVDYHIWTRVDFLLWNVTPTPLPALVISPAPNGIGTSGGTLLGGLIDFGLLPGARLAGGLWFDPDAIFGSEGSVFFLNSVTENRSFQGNSSGLPTLAIPFVSTIKGETFTVISAPGSSLNGFPAGSPTLGSVSLHESLKLYGGNLDLVVTGCRTQSAEVLYFLGFKALYLQEGLEFGSVSTSPGNPTLVRGDNFTTRNFFYGGEVGMRTICRRDICFLELTGKVAVGNNFEVVEISGQTTSVPKPGQGAVVTTPGGFFAQPSNIGHYTQNQFTIVPEVQARVGLELSSHLKVFLGYDFLFINNVARPGNQVDRLIGPTAPPGVTHPTFSDAAIQNSSFSAHGASIGLELRF